MAAVAPQMRGRWVFGLLLALSLALPFAAARAQDAEEILDEDRMPDATLIGGPRLIFDATYQLTVGNQRLADAG